MADKDTLWTAVKAAYVTEALLPITNIHDETATSINDTVGTEAARQLIGIWPSYAEVTFAIANEAHLMVAIEGTVAILQRRGGTSSATAKRQWDDVFGEGGMLVRLKLTSPRGHLGPSSNSGVTQKAETVNGQRVRPWSDPVSLPGGGQFLLPRRVISDGT